MPVKKRLNPKRLGERNRFLENRPLLPKDRFKLKRKKPRIGEGLAGVKRKVKAKSAEELYDSKRKSFRGSKIENFKLGGIAKTLINKYKPKIKNEKEVYSKQDYSGVIKNYEKTQQRKKRNRAGAVIGGATAAAAIQSKKDKENKK